MSKVSHEAIDMMLESRTTTIARDLKLNLKRLLEEGALNPAEALSALLAIAVAVEDSSLANHARVQLAVLGTPADLIQEAAESAALMGMLNTYYKFRHMLGKEDEYKTASLRMTALAKPALGKEHFEMLAFAVSVVNGCETCIRSHESVLRQAGVSVDKIHDLARIASVVKGLKALAIAV